MSLVEIQIEDLPALRDKFKVDWPTHVVAFNLLDCFIKRYSDKPEGFKQGKFFSLNGDWESDGTFLAHLRESELLFATLDINSQRLKTALCLFPFGPKMTFFMCVRDVYCPMILEVIAEQKLETLFHGGTTMKFMRKAEAKKLDVEIPEKFQLRPLRKEHAERINSVWPQRSEGSVVYIEYMMDYNIHLGLYDENDELVAWCLQLDFGSLATLQVDDKHFRKGYGQIITKAISKKIASDCDADITSNVVHDNVKSLNLFAKLGFEEIDKNHWIGVRKPE